MPTVPTPSPVAVPELLGAASREIEQTRSTRAATQSVGSTFFARRPALAYNAAQNVQGPDGVITGTLNGSQADGYALDYTVTGAPAHGSVAVSPAGDFSYTPTTEFASLGGTDTFTVSADDRPGNPRHWHGLATLFAPNGGHTATETVTVLENPGTPLPPSVLATTDQLNAEKLAVELASSPIVQLAKLVLKAGWVISAHTNFAKVGGPDAENMARLDRAIDEYAIQAALEVQLLDSANPTVIQQVSTPHDWYLQDFPGSRIWYDNPDTIYRFIGANSASSYVITGRFDGALPADTDFSVLTGLSGTTASSLSGRDLVLNPDGSFTVTASSAPATPGQPNHLQLAPGTTLITTRNTLADWNSEEPMSLTVLRVSGPPPSLFSQIGGFAIPGIGEWVAGNPLLTTLVSLIPPLPSGRLVKELETAVIMLLLGISGENTYMGVATTDPKTGERRDPNILTDPDRNAEFLATQLQSAGYFQLTDSEALVVTIDPGNARYFTVPVTDVWTITGNYWDEQTSLNIGQSIANPDGTYTFVLSPADPGVANWVSTGGLNQGTISIRFQDLDRISHDTPKVNSQVVPINGLGAVLPPTTVYVTAEERRAQIAQRQLGYNRRWAPYPQA
ncbi:MAG: hypothetical protein K0U67_01480 [Actinomycetia bacterium]|nr:hypothetical protein [Actinomycetes bacterium]